MDTISHAMQAPESNGRAVVDACACLVRIEAGGEADADARAHGGVVGAHGGVVGAHGRVVGTSLHSSILHRMSQWQLLVQGLQLYKCCHIIGMT